MKRLIVLAATMLMPTAAVAAADQVALDSKIYVERTAIGADGKSKIVREAPNVVTPGDKLIFELNYKNAGNAPADAFTVTNPIPASVSFVSSEGAGAIHSVDGGTTWGPLEQLKLKNADGSLRAATPADITHIRWTFSRAIPVGGSGTLSFSGSVK